VILIAEVGVQMRQAVDQHLARHSRRVSPKNCGTSKLSDIDCEISPDEMILTRATYDHAARGKVVRDRGELWPDKRFKSSGPDFQAEAPKVKCRCRFPGSSSAGKPVTHDRRVAHAKSFTTVAL